MSFFFPLYANIAISVKLIIHVYQLCVPFGAGNVIWMSVYNNKLEYPKAFDSCVASHFLLSKPPQKSTIRLCLLHVIMLTMDNGMGT